MYFIRRELLKEKEMHVFSVVGKDLTRGSCAVPISYNALDTRIVTLQANPLTAPYFTMELSVHGDA